MDWFAACMLNVDGRGSWIFSYSRYCFERDPIPPSATTEKPATCPPSVKCRDDQECVYDNYAEYW